MNDFPYKLNIINDGGKFVYRVLRWDGAAWEPVSGTLCNNPRTACDIVMAFYQAYRARPYPPRREAQRRVGFADDTIPVVVRHGEAKPFA